MHQEQPAGSAPAAVTAGRDAWRAAPGGLRPPADIDRVVAVIWPLWARLTRPGARSLVVRLIRGELATVRCYVADPGDETTAADEVQGVIAGRLARRLASQGGHDQVRDPIAWLRGRGLPQRRECGDATCDDGLDLTTGGGPCRTCDLRIGDARALRDRAGREAREALPPTASTADQQAAYTARLAELELARQLDQITRWERAASERAAREKASARRQAEQAVRDAEQRARPCDRCGAPESAGRCQPCAEQATADQLLDELVTLDAATTICDTGPLPTPELNRELDRARTATHSRLRHELDTLDAAGATSGTLALAARLTLETWLDTAHADLHASLTAGETAQTAAQEAVRLARQTGRLDLDHAATRARTRVAQEMITAALDHVRTATNQPCPAERGCPGLHGTPCGRPTIGSHGLCLRHHSARLTQAK